MKIVVVLLVFVMSFSLSYAQKSDKKLSEKSSGNPLFPGWYADPEGIVFGNQYWIYPTFSDDYGKPDRSEKFSDEQLKAQKNTINPQYLKQTFFNAFSSKDLICLLYTSPSPRD